MDVKQAAGGALGLLVLLVLGCGSDAEERVSAAVGAAAQPREAARAQLTRIVLGGRGFEAIRDVDVDAGGSVFVAGSTDSPDFPTTPGVQDGTLGQGERSHDAFVARFSPSGELVWSRLLGGPEYDRAYALEVAPDGTLVVAGRAGEGFPVTQGAAQTRFAGGTKSKLYGSQDGFVCRLDPEQGDVRFCTYFGVADGGILRDVDVTPENDIVVVGGRAESPQAPEWPERSGRREVSGVSDGIVAKLAGDGSRVLWTRLIGGSRNDGGTPSVRVDRDGSIVVLMFTGSDDLPVTRGAFDSSYGGEGDLFVARLEPDGSALRFLTYLGGSEVEFTETHGLALDADGSVVVAAVTRSPDFPTTEGALQPVYGGTGGRNQGARTNYSGDGFVARLAPDGTKLLASTFLGGEAGDGIEGVALNDSAIAVSGATFSRDMPGAPGGWGRSDWFVVRLAPRLDRLLSGARFGGAGHDWGRAMAIGPDGRAWSGGVTWHPVASSDRGRPGDPPGEAEAILLEVD